MYKLSPSSLGLFEECPRCFYLQIVKNIKRPGGEMFPSLPRGMDKILKEHFDRFRDKDKLPPELKHEDCVKGCSLFNDHELLRVWRNNLKGIEYIDKKSGIKLRGAVDNILVKGKKLIVLDFKTRGYPLKEDTHEHYQTQMDIYNFLLRKNGYETEDFAFLLFYYPDQVKETGEVIFHTHLKEMPISVNRAEKVFKEAINVLNGRMPKSSKECGYCKYRGEG